MARIELVMNNRTKLDLIFSYNEINYRIGAGRSQTENVEAGHYISARDPNNTKVTRQKIMVEGDLFVSVLDRDIVIDCDLTGWELRLHLGVKRI